MVYLTRHGRQHHHPTSSAEVRDAELLEAGIHRLAVLRRLSQRSQAHSARDSCRTSGGVPGKQGEQVVNTDIRFENHGSIWLARSLTAAGGEWIDDHVNWEQMFCGAVVIEPRYVGVIARGAAEAGLGVEVK